MHCSIYLLLAYIAPLARYGIFRAGVVARVGYINERASGANSFAVIQACRNSSALGSCFGAFIGGLVRDSRLLVRSRATVPMSRGRRCPPPPTALPTPRAPRSRSCGTGGYPCLFLMRDVWLALHMADLYTSRKAGRAGINKICLANSIYDVLLVPFDYLFFSYIHKLSTLTVKTTSTFATLAASINLVAF